MAVRTDQMTTFTYTTYIHAAPEQIWRGLTDPAMTKRYWRHQKACRRPSIRTGRRARPGTWNTKMSGSSWPTANR